MDAHGLAASEAVPRSSWPAFVRHFLEMVIAMWIGMAAGGLIFAPILAALGITPVRLACGIRSSPCSSWPSP